MGGALSRRHEDTQVQDPMSSLQHLKIDPYDIMEENIEASTKHGHGTFSKVCNECIKGLLGKATVATCICYQCEIYTCAKCFEEHVDHAVTVRKGIDKDIDMLREHMFLEKDRDDVFMEGNFLLIEQIYIELFYGYHVTNLCMLSNGNLAVCVSDRSIRFFDSVSFKLQRCIRLGAEPCGMAEFMSNTTNTRRLNRSLQGTFPQDDDCLVAVTVPYKKGILFIDLCKSPAKVVKTIHLESECFDIAFNNDRIYVLCYASDFMNWSIRILTHQGEVLTNTNTLIPTILRTYLPFYSASNMTIHNGKIYIISHRYNKVYCFDFDDASNLSSKSSFPVPRASWICSDNQKHVYVCADDYFHVYKVDNELSKFEFLFNDVVQKIKPGPMCIYKDKLIVANDDTFSGNLVSVFGLIS